MPFSLLFVSFPRPAPSLEGSVPLTGVPLVTLIEILPPHLQLPLLNTLLAAPRRQSPPLALLRLLNLLHTLTSEDFACFACLKQQPDPCWGTFFLLGRIFSFPFPFLVLLSPSLSTPISVPRPPDRDSSPLAGRRGPLPFPTLLSTPLFALVPAASSSPLLPLPATRGGHTGFSFFLDCFHEFICVRIACLLHSDLP